MFYAYLDESPVGRLLVAGTDAGLKHVAFSQTHFSSPDVQPQPDWEENESVLSEPIRQLRAYFDGQLRQFDLPLAAEGTEFQRRVWAALCDIPFGETASYGDIARSVGNPAAWQTVGLANGRNPIAIIVPCHRVIGRSGKLVGYGGDLTTSKPCCSTKAFCRPRFAETRSVNKSVYRPAAGAGLA